MADKEKVILGLEICTNPGSCSERCPYYHIEITEGSCDYFLLTDALALLKEQEPRVMVLEEVLESDKPFLIEVVTGNITWASCFGEYCLCNEMIVRMVDNDGAVDDRYEEMYGTKWRCWTSRPSEQQMRDTPWEGGRGL